MVMDDSVHTYEHTLKVLEHYADVVTVGNYFIVEDGICHHGLDVGPQPGPYEAVERFMQTNRASSSTATRRTRHYMESQGISQEDRLNTGKTGTGEVERLRDAYLSLIEKCLTGLIFTKIGHFKLSGMAFTTRRFAKWAEIGHRWLTP